MELGGSMAADWQKLGSKIEQLGKKGRLALMAVMLLPLIIISSLNLIWTWHDLTHAAMLRRHAVAELAGVVLKEKLDHLTELGLSLSTRVRFRELVAEEDWQEAIKILDEVPGTFADINRIFLTDTNGVLMAQTPVAGNTAGQSFSHRDWYRGVSQTWHPYVSEIYQRAAEPQYLVVAIAVPIKKGSSLTGILVMQVRISSFVSWLDHLQKETANIYLVDKNGYVAGHPSVSDEQIVSYAEVPVVKKALQGKQGVEVAYNPIEKEKRVSAYLPIPKYQWSVVSYEPTATAFASRTRQMLNIIIIQLLVLVLMGLLSYSALKILEERRQRIVESARLQRELEKRANELQVINRELEAFSYSISHDLRSPLSSIYGYSDLLQEEHASALNDDGRHLLKSIRHVAKRMDSTINDLLQLSRQANDPIAYKTVNMNELVSDIISSLLNQNRDRAIQFVVEDLPDIPGDPLMLRLVLQNLLDNAVKYSKKRTPAVIHVGAKKNELETTYWVKDNGAGFDMKYADQLFKVFQRLHSKFEFEGTGIGLSIVERIIQRHGGRVWATSVVQQGSEFYFTLPHITEPSSPAA